MSQQSQQSHHFWKPGTREWNGEWATYPKPGNRCDAVTAVTFPRNSLSSKPLSLSQHFRNAVTPPRARCDTSKGNLVVVLLVGGGLV